MGNLCKFKCLIKFLKLVKWPHGRNLKDYGSVNIFVLFPKCNYCITKIENYTQIIIEADW